MSRPTAVLITRPHFGPVRGRIAVLLRRMKNRSG
jgi:hypothetical protein